VERKDSAPLDPASLAGLPEDQNLNRDQPPVRWQAALASSLPMPGQTGHGGSSCIVGFHSGGEMRIGSVRQFAWTFFLHPFTDTLLIPSNCDYIRV
jgi:hypothetical protein